MYGGLLQFAKPKHDQNQDTQASQLPELAGSEEKATATATTNPTTTR